LRRIVMERAVAEEDEQVRMSEIVLRDLACIGKERARVARRIAELQERTLQTVRAARELGIGAPSIARELEVSHQAVYQMLEGKEARS
jgi:hypothetical protein